jgi:hypothetical protein
MRRAIYDYFTTQTDSNGDTFNLGTFEEFEKDMNDPKIRKSFYDYMSSQIDDNGDYYNLGTFEEFEKDVAPKKTISLKNIEQQGYPFFAGEMSLVGEVEIGGGVIVRIGAGFVERNQDYIARHTGYILRAVIGA